MTANTNPHLYALIACEVSGDTLGAGLMKAILRHDPEARFIGIGGEKMTAAGMVSAFKMEELSVMGFFEVLAHAVPILRIRSQITKILLEAKPCVMIGIDAPDFNLAVEHRLKKAGISTIHYVSPSVWAWREKRIEKIKASCDEVLALLPFEKDFYDRHDMACTYVGHTLAAQINLEVDQQRARERCGLYRNSVDGTEGKYLAILPGSRRGVIRRMLPIYARTARLLREKIKDLNFITVAPNRDIALLIKDIWLEHTPEISITVFVGMNQDVIASADVCLLTCGTIAFEAMLLKRPMVVAYKVSPLSAAIARRMLKVNMYSLPNLLARREIVKELIQENCVPINLCQECIRLLTSDNLLMKKEFAAIHESIRTNTDELAARAVLRLAAASAASAVAGSVETDAAAVSAAAVSVVADDRSQDKSLVPDDAAKAGKVPEARAADRKNAAEPGSGTDGVAGAAQEAEGQDKAVAAKSSHGFEVRDENYRKFLESSQGAEISHRAAVPGRISTKVMDTAREYGAAPKAGDRSEITPSLNRKPVEEVPLAHGLDDKTIARLQQEIKDSGPHLSLEQVLSMPDPDSKTKKVSRSNRSKNRI